MTTIAFDCTILAVDNCFSYGSKLIPGNKMFRFVDQEEIEWIAVGAGDAAVTHMMMNWFKAPADAKPQYPTVGDDDTLLLWNSRNQLFQMCSNAPVYFPLLSNTPITLGSGAQAALAAIRAYDASAPEAVIAAALADCWTAPSGHYAELVNGSFVVREFESVDGTLTYESIICHLNEGR